MTGRFNGGRFFPYEDDGVNDPSSDFPIQETVEDFTGRKRKFEIAMHEHGLGFTVQADEVEKDGLGYQFSGFDATSPYLALGRLRDKMRRVLSTRHLAVGELGGPLPVHDTLRGRITSSDGEVAFVVDGQPLTLSEFGTLVATHEGFDFTFRFLDGTGDE